MNTRQEDDAQYRELLNWYSGKAESRRRTDKSTLREMRPAVLLLVLSLVCFWAAFARAATVQLTCTAPTKNTDGTNISAPLTYKAYWGTSATSLTNPSTLSGPGCKGPVVVPDPAPGATITYHFAVTAIAAGQESAKSNIATKTFTTPNPTPNPPALLTAETVAYQINLGSNNKIYFSRVGTIELDRACIAGMTAMDKTVLQSRDWVKLDVGKTRPRQMFVRCKQS
jgi:hypothetical protein